MGAPDQCTRRHPGGVNIPRAWPANWLTRAQKTHQNRATWATAWDTPLWRGDLQGDKQPHMWDHIVGTGALVVLWLAVIVGTTRLSVRTQVGRLVANLGPLFFFCIVPLDPGSPLARSFCAIHRHHSFSRLRAILNYRFYDSVVTPSYRLVLP